MRSRSSGLHDGDNQNPVNIAKAAVEHARKEGMNLVFLDTAGRLQIDESMMDELVNIKEAVEVTRRSSLSTR